MAIDPVCKMTVNETKAAGSTDLAAITFDRLRTARRTGTDGVICGHIHTAAIRDEHGIRYMNCGDWVESCTAIAEHEDGQFEIITWTDLLKRNLPVATVAARAA